MRRKWLSPRSLLWHLLLAIIVPGCLLAGWWQVHRAMAGNLLSYGYSVEWPAFAIIAVIGWWQLIQEDPADVEERKEERWRRTHPTPGRSLDLLLGEIAAHPEVLEAFPDLKRAYPELLRSHPDLVEGHPELVAFAEAARPRPEGWTVAAVPPSRPGSDLVPVSATPGADEPSAPIGEPAPSDELRSYNDYLAGLAQGGRPKTWRNPHGR